MLASPVRRLKAVPRRFRAPHSIFFSRSLATAAFHLDAACYVSRQLALLSSIGKCARSRTIEHGMSLLTVVMRADEISGERTEYYNSTNSWHEGVGFQSISAHPLSSVANEQLAKTMRDWLVPPPPPCTLDTTVYGEARAWSPTTSLCPVRCVHDLTSPAVLLAVAVKDVRHDPVLLRCARPGKNLRSFPR